MDTESTPPNDEKLVDELVSLLKSIGISDDNAPPLNAEQVNDYQKSTVARYVRKLGLRIPSMLYHYTDYHAFLSILESHALWATNLMYLNDTEEFLYSKKIFTDVLTSLEPLARSDQFTDEFNQIITTLEKVSLDLSSIYVACFSEDPDSLNLWRGYTSSSSRLCIGFRYPLAIEHDNGAMLGRQYVCAPCIYDEYTQIRLVKGFILRCIWNYRRGKLTGPGIVETEDGGCESNCGMMWSLLSEAKVLAAMIKHPAFKDEREWRIIYLGGENKVRASSSTIIPYTCMYFSPPITHGQPSGKRFYKEIASVVIGPCPHPALVARSVKGALEQAGCFLPDVSNSKVPYRDW